MLDDAPWPPRDEPEEPRGGRKHEFGTASQDVCRHCGLSFAAFTYLPNTPCNPAAARQANSLYDREMGKRGIYRRGSF